MKYLVFALLFCSSLLAEKIDGFWKSLNNDTKKPECMVAIYPYKGLYYGRIVATYDKDGKIKETIYDPKERAPGLPGHPYYCGLDLVWDLQDFGSRYKGKVVDPEKGNVYNAEVWIENGNLILRGKLMFFGQSRTWVPATDKDFSLGFKKPNVSEFVPVIPVDEPPNFNN